MDVLEKRDPAIDVSLGGYRKRFLKGRAIH